MAQNKYVLLVVIAAIAVLALAIVLIDQKNKKSALQSESPAKTADTGFLVSPPPQPTAPLPVRQFELPIYRELGKLASFPINNISITAKIVSIDNKHVTLESANKEQLTFPLSPRKVTLRTFNIAAKTETTSTDLSTLVAGKGVIVYLSPLETKDGTFEITEFFYSIKEK